ncbi:MAG: hypothetical protein RL154_1276 [Pseudomonadota bacterium]|jgi:signal transduction histidine kinase
MQNFKQKLSNFIEKMGIRAKLIAIFVIIKIVPLLFLAWIAIEGAYKIADFFEQDSNRLAAGNAKIVKETADSAIADAVVALDKKSQQELETLTQRIAKEVASFLYARNEDLLLLATSVDMNEKNLQSFFSAKTRDVVEHPPYYYDEANKSWKAKTPRTNIEHINATARLKDNEQEFSLYSPADYTKKRTPLYREITFVGLDGVEKIKVGNLSSSLKDISKKENTFVKAEDYFPKLAKLKQNEIYVSDMIGAYVGSKVIGKFTPESAKKAGIEFEPEKYGYAGKENPVGKHFEGIVRFATPVYKNGEKIGYVTFALDQRHIAEFTDTILPLISPYTDIKDASAGNYAFIWDYKGRSIAHPRDYSICGYDPATGKPIPGWISKDLADKFAASGMSDLNEFLAKQPTFEEQSSAKKPNVAQIKEGKVPLDCRYLNFAPQCDGWMQLTENGGYGSFMIKWSGVTKLTTAAAIPYYTGQYGASKRGFGFVTIGANVDEFHSAANDAKKKVQITLEEQAKSVEKLIDESKQKMLGTVASMITNLSITTIILLILIVLIAFWIAKYIVAQIEELVIGADEFAKGNLNYRVKSTSKDEVGQLAHAYNAMADSIKNLVDEQKHINETLEVRVKEEVSKSREKDALMAKQARLAAMGEMIGNIAHQWRQPLNSLGLIMQELNILGKRDLLTNDKVKESATESKKYIDYMSSTIDDFRNFFASDKAAEQFNLAKLTNESIEMIANAISSANLSVTVQGDETLEAYGYPNEFKQALLVILTNAKDAIVLHNSENGSIKIDIFEISETTNGISIKDSGGGISDDIIEKIFDPYFTTKHKAQGAGIGLYMAKNIIEVNMHGKLSAENSENGAIFTIELPKNK